MTLKSGERQVAPTLKGIRRDHRERYEWAAKVLPARSDVIDIACGIGYGSRILVEAGHFVTGADISAESIDYAREHYAHRNAKFTVANANTLDEVTGFSAAVCFETIEHVPDPRMLLLALRGCKTLLASVPNEDVWPYTGQAWHHRHYRPKEFAALLNSCGWNVVEWFKQDGTESPVEPGHVGRTVIVRAQ